MLWFYIVAAKPIKNRLWPQSLQVVNHINLLLGELQAQDFKGF